MRTQSVMKTLVMTVALLGAPLVAQASSNAEHPKQVDWSFDGFFGTVDRQSAQRGLQVYKEVCAACHGLKRVAYRSLTELGFSDDEVKSLAASYSYNTLDDAGETIERAGIPADRFKSPYANEAAARASNNGAYPPDLSLIIKARPDGANYVFSLLTGYEDAPADVTLGDGMSYNPYFPGHQIGMPAPLMDGLLSYEDGSEATTEQMAKDVVNFLQWAAEPEMEARKRMGIKVILFLMIAAVFFYIAKQRIWAKVYRGDI